MLSTRSVMVLRPMVYGNLTHTLPTTSYAARNFSSTSYHMKAADINPRAFHSSTPDNASTALKPGVRERELERTGGNIVGDEVRGSEGPHYNDKENLPSSASQPVTLSGAWTMMNPIYSEKALEGVQVVYRPPETMSDKVVLKFVKTLRRVFDLVTGYKNIPISDATMAMKPIPIEELRSKGQLLSDKAWLIRCILLESIAGVPGMVGGTLRHLRSLRLLRRDGGWISTLLSEAENERMHLLTFMTIAQPSLFMRALVLGAQGIFYNGFFLTYLISPRTAHRFVGCLEEEAVRTYTHCISDIEKGLVPEWKDMAAPQIAIDYWRLHDNAQMLDVIKAIRADEATHRFVNHSLANLDQKRDFNPFALGEADAEIRGAKYGFTREESAEFARQSQERIQHSHEHEQEQVKASEH